MFFCVLVLLRGKLFILGTEAHVFAFILDTAQYGQKPKHTFNADRTGRKTFTTEVNSITNQRDTGNRKTNIAEIPLPDELRVLEKGIKLRQTLSRAYLSVTGNLCPS